MHLAEIDALLAAEGIVKPVSIAIEENVPETVRKLRAARLKRKLKRIEASKGRAGDNHYKRKRMKRREEYQKYDLKWRRDRYHRQFKTVEGRYNRARELWARRLSPEMMADCMSLEEFSRLMKYKPDKVRELYPGIKVDSRTRNLDNYREYHERYRNRYPNEDRIIDCMYKIVRNDVSRAYTLDNVLVLDQYTHMVYYDSIYDNV